MSVYPDTSDGRYFVVKGRLWRKIDPRLSDDERQRLVSEPMSARRAVRNAKGRHSQMALARQRVAKAKSGWVNVDRSGVQTARQIRTADLSKIQRMPDATASDLEASNFSLP